MTERTEKTSLSIDKIRIDGDVFFDGAEYYLVDGFHRLLAAMLEVICHPMTDEQTRTDKKGGARPATNPKPQVPE